MPIWHRSGSGEACWCHSDRNPGFLIQASPVISLTYTEPVPGMPLDIYQADTIKKEGKTMMTLWIVIGCLFMTGIGIRFTYRVLGLTKVEAAAVFVLIVLLVGVNTAPAREALMRLLY